MRSQTASFCFWTVSVRESSERNVLIKFSSWNFGYLNPISRMTCGFSFAEHFSPDPISQSANLTIRELASSTLVRSLSARCWWLSITQEKRVSIKYTGNHFEFQHTRLEHFVMECRLFNPEIQDEM